MKSFDFNRELNCPGCSHKLETATATTGPREMVDGDLSLCIYCGELSLFRTGPMGLYMQTPTIEELAKVMAEPGIRHLVRRFQELRAAHPKLGGRS